MQVPGPSSSPGFAEVWGGHKRAVPGQVAPADSGLVALCPSPSTVLGTVTFSFLGSVSASVLRPGRPGRKAQARFQEDIPEEAVSHSPADRAGAIFKPKQMGRAEADCGAARLPGRREEVPSLRDLEHSLSRRRNWQLALRAFWYETVSLGPHGEMVSVVWLTSTSGHSGCFHVLTVVNSAAPNTGTS